MSHYEKQAIVIIRVIGCCIFVFALVALVYNVLGLTLSSKDYFGLGIYSSLSYGIVGAALFAMSKPLSALIARGL